MNELLGVGEEKPGPFRVLSWETTFADQGDSKIHTQHTKLERPGEETIKCWKSDYFWSRLW
jgi:hypothetical protein